MTEPGQAPATPHEIFERWQQSVLRNEPAGPAGIGELSAPDVVIEVPFAPPGHPRYFAGLGEFLAFAGPRRTALPVRFEAFRNVTVHQTTDPQVIVAEYELCGTVTTTAQQASASFITVITVRDGKVVRWREYQDTLGMAAALGRLPELLASTSPGPASCPAPD